MDAVIILVSVLFGYLLRWAAESKPTTPVMKVELPPGHTVSLSSRGGTIIESCHDTSETPK